MSKASDKLTREIGGNISESVSTTPDPSGTPAPPPPPPGGVKASAKNVGTKVSQATREIPLDRIIADPDQPRKTFEPESIAAMAESLKRRGQLMPIRVRWAEEIDRWVIIAGERRYRGALMAGMATITAVERKAAPGASAADESASILQEQLVENMLREDLAPIEEAEKFHALMTARGWSGNQLAQELSISQTTVVHRLALLKLPAEIQDAVNLETLSASSAYEVSKIADPEVQKEVAAQVIDQGLGLTDTRRVVAVAAANQPREKGKKGRAVKGPKKVWSAKTSGGYRVTVESRKGVPPSALPEIFAELKVQTEAALAPSA